jgi:hypothetical protein
MLDTVENELPLDTAAKRALIESELRENPQRSDRAIAQAVGHGVCHKTVGAARERLGIASPLGNSAAPKTREQLLLETLPPDIDVNSLAFNADRAKVDAIAAAETIREKLGLNQEENHFLPESESLVLPSQPAIAVYTNRYNQVVIRQEASGYQDEDFFVYICPQHLDALIVRLRTFLP